MGVRIPPRPPFCEELVIIIKKLIQQEVLIPGGNLPRWLGDNTVYLCQMGSVAYGCSSDDSDIDVYGFCIPPKNIVFPYATTENILGFGPKPESFEQWQQHHVKTLDGKREYDFSIYNIVKFFQLVAENNPNTLDALHVPQRCVLHCTEVGQIVRDNRDLFVHKGSYHKFRGYAYAQKAKIQNKTNSSNPKRAKYYEDFGFDVKFAYHIVRLALEAEQILQTGTLDLECNSEILKSIRRGEWSLEKINEWFDLKEKHLEDLYNRSTLRHSPDWDELRKLLVKCLEHHYGSLDKFIKKERVPFEQLISDMQSVIDKYQ